MNEYLLCAASIFLLLVFFIYMEIRHEACISAPEIYQEYFQN